MSGQILGTAGGSLGSGLFGERGKVGGHGETRSAQALALLADRGPSVVHDLRIPIPGFQANIDHAVVSGRRVTLIDSKVWKGGFYWTLRGKTRRGFEAVPHADKKTLPTGRDGFRRHFRNLGVDALIAETGILLVWPTQNTPFRSWLYKPAGARVVTGASPELTSRHLARVTGTKPADPQVLSAVATLIYR